MLLTEANVYGGKDGVIKMFNDLSFEATLMLISHTSAKRLKIVKGMLSTDESKLIAIIDKGILLSKLQKFFLIKGKQ